MKKAYITPTLMFEDLEIDCFMAVVNNSQWDISGENGAGDNADNHGQDLDGNGGGGHEYELPPGLGE